MTRKHFQAIAAIIAGDFACANAEGKLTLFRATLSLADYFVSVNPRFDRVKFYKACGFSVDSTGFPSIP